MKLNKLGNTNIKVSPIGFGVLTVGKTQLNLPISEGAELIKYAFKRGINFLDTAQYYETYPYIKEALKDHNYQPIIASKCLDYTYNEMKFAVEEARREMDRDIIDIFLLHEVRHDSDFQDRAGAWEYLQEAKLKGLVKAIGISTHHADVASHIASVNECDVLFPLINKDGLGIRYGNQAGTIHQMVNAIEKNHKSDKGIFAMKVFGGGNLTGSYMECMDFVSSITGIDSMMIGFGTKEEVDRAVEYAEKTIDKNYVPDISKKKITIEQGDCEACLRCIDRCPNKAIFINKKGLPEVDHNICLTCGYCAPVCPVRAIIML